MHPDPRHEGVLPPGPVPQPLARWMATPLTLWAVRRDTVIRLIRYAAVSVISTTTTLVMLGALVGLVGMAATWSNVIATAVGTVPSFELNRRWVWSNDGRRSLFGQVVPFCALSFAELVVSTLAVGVVAGHTSGWGHWSHTAAVVAANVAAYGTLWVVQYRLLDRVLFRRDPVRDAVRESVRESVREGTVREGVDESAIHAGRDSAVGAGRAL